MLNKQIPIKQELGDGLILSINSIFYTIQGEGMFAGNPAIFIRLAGCNLQCPSCDTDYAYGVRWSVSQITNQVAELVCESMTLQPIVVITGGEPFRQNIQPLIKKLLMDCGLIVQVETNGTLFVDLGVLFIHPNFHIVCSPKAGKVNKSLYHHIKAYKYVVHADSIDPDDGLPILALEHSASPKVARPHAGFKGIVYVQPIDTQDPQENKRHLKAAIDSCMNHGYRLCLQLHKILGME